MSGTLEAALALHRQGQLGEARRLYQEILGREPDHVHALHYSGLIALQIGEPGQAVELIGRAIARQPHDALAHFNRGSAFERLKRFDEALADYGQALALKPDFVEALSNRAAVLNRLGRYAEALASAERALGINARFVEAHFNRAVALAELSRESEALQALDQALQLRPGHIEAEINRGALLERRGEWEAALESTARVLKLAPRNLAAHLNRGKLHLRLSRLESALDDCDNALAIDASCAVAHMNRGNVLSALGQTDEALSSYRHALSLNDSLAEAHFNMGNLYRGRGDLSAAVAAYSRSLQWQADYPAALCNRGLSYAVLGELDKALGDYDEALVQNPRHAQARYNRAFVHLRRGEFIPGWRDYEARFDGVAGSSGDVPKERHAPRWQGGASLAGKSILVYAEQGFGDTLQFCRYVPLLSRLGARVILDVPDPLIDLLTSLEGAPQLLRGGAPLPPCDYSCPLMSLPLALGTTLATIPAQVPYLRADPDRVQAWRLRLGSARRMRVGLVWSGGNHPQQADTWSAVDRRRNLPLPQLAHLKEVPVEFISLQKGQPAEGELQSLQRSAWNGPPIRDCADELHDFADTAALLTQLDLLLSVDTATAHLAGALAKPVWILNRHDACWRWLEDRSDSPWYPTAKLYRQSAPGDWDEVMRRVAEDLERFARPTESAGR